MLITVLQHVPFEGPAALADWAASRGAGLDVVHLYRKEALPELAQFDMLVVMGGPMSVNDERDIPWLGPEIGFVRDAVAAGKTVLGICLGAQMIAKALGAKVYAAREKEIGWFPVQRHEHSHLLFRGVPAEFVAFHWHGETFDLPQGARLLASTEAVANQAFAVGERVLGLQFHLEATPESIQALVENAADDIGHGPFQQPAHEILVRTHRCLELRPILDRVLDNLTGLHRKGT